MDDNDLIRRGDAVYAAEMGADDWDGGCNKTRDKYIEEAFANIPAVDAVEVVRCRDCMKADQYGHCEMQNFWGTRDDYCSRGQRREDGDA